MKRPSTLLDGLLNAALATAAAAIFLPPTVFCVTFVGVLAASAFGGSPAATFAFLFLGFGIMCLGMTRNEGGTTAGAGEADGAPGPLSRPCPSPVSATSKPVTDIGRVVIIVPRRAALHK